MAKSVDRLMEIQGGTTWDGEMQAILDEEGNGGGLFAVTTPSYIPT